VKEAGGWWRRVEVTSTNLHNLHILHLVATLSLELV
jgi:hypothetical protein